MSILDLKQRAKQLAADIPAVAIALRRPETPLPAKILAAVTVAYALSPIDLIPDFIPVIGLLDDVILLPALVALVVKLIPPDVLAQCRVQAAAMWADGKPKKWYFAVPIVAIWLIILFFVVKAIWF